MREPFEVRFWKKVAIADANECWLWQGCITTAGYGHVKFRGRSTGAHRVAWMLAAGREIPSGQYICHSCDTPLCCNPKHLWAGAPRDNIMDAARKGKGCNRRGEGNGQAKLTEKEVAEIRKSLDDGVSARSLAYRYGVGASTIANIKARNTWFWLATA